MFDYQKHVALMAIADYAPKHHMMFHLVAKSLEHGNPSYYANWTDEALNRTLKSGCQGVSQRTFETSALLRMRDILLASKAPTKRRR